MTMTSHIFFFLRDKHISEVIEKCSYNLSSIYSYSLIRVKREINSTIQLYIGLVYDHIAEKKVKKK